MLFVIGVPLFLILQRDPDRKLIPRPAPDLPAPGEQAARNVRALRPLGLHRAGNEELTRRDGAALPHHRPAVVSAHLGDEGIALRDDVRGRAVIRQLGLGHAVAHADVGAAAADVDRQPRKLGQLRQGAVADVLRAEGVGKAAAAQPLLFQHAQDLFRRDGLAAADLEIPDEEGISKEQREHERQPCEQRIAAAKAAQEKGRALRALDGQRGVERREEPLELFPLGGTDGEGQRARALPSEVGKGDAVRAAEVEHPLGKGALHAHAQRAAQQPGRTIHGPLPPPYRRNSTPSMRPPMRTSRSVMLLSVSPSPVTRSTAPPTLTSMSSVP